MYLYVFLHACMHVIMYILFIIIISCISHLLNGIYTYIFTVILIYLFDDDWFPTEGNATPSDAGPFSFHLFWGELLPAGPLLVGWLTIKWLKRMKWVISIGALKMEHKTRNGFIVFYREQDDNWLGMLGCWGAPAFRQKILSVWILDGFKLLYPPWYCDSSWPILATSWLTCICFDTR